MLLKNIVDLFLVLKINHPEQRRVDGVVQPADSHPKASLNHILHLHVLVSINFQASETVLLSLELFFKAPHGLVKLDGVVGCLPAPKRHSDLMRDRAGE